MLPFSDEDLVEPVLSVLASVRPMLQADGGDLSFLGILNGRVFIQLEGACKGCVASSITLKDGVERALRNEIHPELVIVNVPHGMEDKWQTM